MHTGVKGQDGRGRVRYGTKSFGAALVVVIVSVLAWTEVVPVLASGAGDGSAVAATTPVTRQGDPAAAATSLAGGFDGLGVRLRVAPSALAVPDAALQLAGPPPSTSTSTTAPSRAGDVVITPPSSFSGPVTRQAPPRELAASQYSGVTPTGGTWALLIGINDYPGTEHDLKSAVADVNDVDAALASFGITADRRMVLRDGQASAGVVRAAFDWLTSHSGPDATMVVFYAGHVQKLGRTTEALVGSDGNAVTDGEVAALLDRSPARRAWITIAGCYGGGFDEVVKPGRILTAAAPADRLAYENTGFGRSYLVEYMVRRGMLGRGISSVEAAYAFATQELRRDFPDRLPVQDDQRDLVSSTSGYRGRHRRRPRRLRRRNRSRRPRLLRRRPRRPRTGAPT